MLDHIDAGFSVLLHIPGFLVPSTPVTIDNITVHTYLPPRQLHHHWLKLESPIGCMVQIFAEEIALPHVLLAYDDWLHTGLPSVSKEVSCVYQLSHEEKQDLSENLIPSRSYPMCGSCFQFMGCKTGDLDRLLAKCSAKAGSPVTNTLPTLSGGMGNKPQPILNKHE